MNLKPLSDQALLESTRSAAKTEREAATAVLHHLREVESRRLFVTLGYPSLFEYAVGDLHYSAPSAQRRIDAMRLLRVLPEVEAKLESGALSLSTLSQAQRFFRQEAKVEKAFAPEAKGELLATLENKSTREVDRELLARASEPLPLKPESVRPVTENLSELRFMADDETLKEVEKIRGLLAHRYPELSMRELFAQMTKITLKTLDPAREPKRRAKAEAEEPQRKTKAKTSTRNSTADTQVSRSVPAPEVMARRSEPLGAKPASVSRYILAPHVQGGTNQLENLRLLCFPCNQREADQKLGREKMESRRKQTFHTPQEKPRPKV